MKENFQTESKKNLAKRDAKILAEYRALMKQHENDKCVKVEICKHLANKYGYLAYTTIYGVIKRAEKRMLQNA